MVADSLPHFGSNLAGMVKASLLRGRETRSPNEIAWIVALHRLLACSARSVKGSVANDFGGVVWTIEHAGLRFVRCGQWYSGWGSRSVTIYFLAVWILPLCHHATQNHKGFSAVRRDGSIAEPAHRQIEHQIIRLDGAQGLVASLDRLWEVGCELCL